jgi:DNA-directed RNA polymerase specialized sigma subunit
MQEAEILRYFKSLINRIVKTTIINSPVVDCNDLMQVASIAAINAVRKYDISAGANLRSYVAKAIRNAVHLEANHFLGPFTLGRGILGMASKIHKLELSGKTELAIANDLDLDVLEVNSLLNVYRNRTMLLEEVNV